MVSFRRIIKRGRGILAIFAFLLEGTNAMLPNRIEVVNDCRMSLSPSIASDIWEKLSTNVRALINFYVFEGKRYPIPLRAYA